MTAQLDIQHGEKCFLNGNLIEAERVFQRLKQQLPHNPQVLNNLGCVLWGAGRTGEALAELERAVALAPAYSEAVVNLSEILKNLGRDTEASFVIEDFRRRHPERFTEVQGCQPQRPGAETVSFYQEPNRFAEKPGLEFGLTTNVSGYQNFVMTGETIEVHPKDRQLKRKRDLTALFFDRDWVRGKTVLDIGANAGFFSFLALLNEAKQAVALDLDPEYNALLKRIRRRLGFTNLDVVQANLMKYDQPADLVLGFALIHWIYSCTAGYGSLSRAVGKLASLTRRALLVEWVEPRDAAISFFKHLDWNPTIHADHYHRPAFEDALAEHFVHYTRLGPLSSTRSLYAAFKDGQAVPRGSIRIGPPSLGELLGRLHEEGVDYVLINGLEMVGGESAVFAKQGLDIMVAGKDLHRLKELLGLAVSRRLVYRGPKGGVLSARVRLMTPHDGCLPSSFAQRLLVRRGRARLAYVTPALEYFLYLIYKTLHHRGVMTAGCARSLNLVAEVVDEPYDPNRAFDFSHLSDILARHALPTRPEPNCRFKPELPYLHPFQDVIYSNLLTTLDGQEQHSRIYRLWNKGRPFVRKQATGDLAWREGLLLSRLGGGLFPFVLDYGREDDFSTCDMEWVDGFSFKDLERFVNEVGPEGLPDFLEGCLEILERLQAECIRHRDIAPGNILVRQGRPVLMDFGWAMADGIHSPTPTHLCRPGADAENQNDVVDMGWALQGPAAVFPELAPLIEAMKQGDKAIPQLRRILDQCLTAGETSDQAG